MTVRGQNAKEVILVSMRKSTLVLAMRSEVTKTKASLLLFIASFYNKAIQIAFH